MAVNPYYATGQNNNAQVIFSGATGVMGNNTTFTTKKVLLNGLRNVVIVLQQLSGVGGVDAVTLGAFHWDVNTELTWQDITPAVTLNVGGGVFPAGAGIPTIIELNIAVEAIKLYITNSSGANASAQFSLLSSG